MKPLLTTFILLISIVPYSFGQFYIQPSVGYTFSTHPEITHSMSIVDHHKNVYKTKYKYADGLHLGLNLGHYISNNIFIELSTKKTVYSIHNISIKEPYDHLLNEYYFRMQSGFFGEIKHKSSMIQISPMIGFNMERDRLSTYFKLGPNFMMSTINLALDYSLEDRQANSKYSGKFQMGLQTNIGFGYSLKENLQVIFDFVTVYNNYLITKTEVTYYKNGEIIHSSKRNGGEEKLNLSHNGLNMGIRYFFIKKG